jgi:hypothetical protein
MKYKQNILMNLAGYVNFGGGNAGFEPVPSYS